MVEGLEVFLRHFAGQAGKYAIIGGTACDYWMEKRGLSFRRTKDLDVVLLIETFDKTFSSLIWDFVRAGRYAISASQPGKGKDPETDCRTAQRRGSRIGFAE